MIKRGIINEELNIDSHLRRENGSCPLLPEEVCPQSTILVPDHVIILVICFHENEKECIVFCAFGNVFILTMVNLKHPGSSFVIEISAGWCSPSCNGLSS